MSDNPIPDSSRKPIDFSLTPRQRRLRIATVVILLFIVGMIIIAFQHPFFHVVQPVTMTPEIKKAMKVKALFIMGYWSICIGLGMSLIFIAWLDVREIIRKSMQVKREFWRDLAEQSRRKNEEG